MIDTSRLPAEFLPYLLQVSRIEAIGKPHMNRTRFELGKPGVSAGVKMIAVDNQPNWWLIYEVKKGVDGFTIAEWVSCEQVHAEVYLGLPDREQL